MKFIKKTSILLLIFSISFSCDELDELTEFDVTTDYETTVSVSVPAGEDLTFSDQTTIDLTADEVIQDNLDAIEDIQLNTLTYEISNYVGVEGALITEASVSAAGITVPVSNIDLQAADASDQQFVIADSTLLNTIANTLQNTNTVTVTLNGTVSDAPVDFDVIIVLDITATVDAG
ncbi:MAG: hypothetical protein Wins2KO_28720 [Winogradskyella sp.]|uniref:hypothetical protein n=1 Tax=Winogradskyella sp. TaxID=1883156 RepID=UPI0025D7E1ED|nr:hypothetical protein [Winogradskyella sp.]NRB60081.1 hypothetical protein [Winogradskyella sp.]